MKYIRALWFFAGTLLIYLAPPLLGWGLGDLAGFVAAPPRAGYAVLTALLGLGVAAQSIVAPEGIKIVFTTEGVLCWLPDLYLWARNVRHLLADDGFLYVMDGHPFFMVWDEDKLPDLDIRYPYFTKKAELNEWIGGYASESKQATNYSWMYTMGEIVTALSKAGLHIEWLHEFDWLYYQLSAEKQTQDAQGNWVYPEHSKKLPYTFSLKATVR